MVRGSSPLRGTTHKNIKIFPKFYAREIFTFLYVVVENCKSNFQLPKYTNVKNLSCVKYVKSFNICVFGPERSPFEKLLSFSGNFSKGLSEGPHTYMKKKSKWHVYILECSDSSLYTGATTNLSRRLNEHNRRKGGGYTRAHLPVKMVYNESYNIRSKALTREAQIKSWTRKDKMALIP